MEALSALLAIVVLVVGIFLILWPFLIWSHLREQTKSLRAISKSLVTEKK